MLSKNYLAVWSLLVCLSCNTLPSGKDWQDLYCCQGLDTLITVVETPAGSTVFNRFNPENNQFEPFKKSLDFLGVPGNWCLLPGTSRDLAHQEAFAPLTMLVLGDAAEAGTLLRAVPIATLLVERNGRDTYFLIGVAVDGPGPAITSYKSLSIENEAIKRILETWLLNYRGLANDRLVGWKEEGFTRELIERHLLEKPQ